MTGTCQDVRPKTKGPRKADFRSGHRQLGSLIATGNNDGGDGKDEHREMIVLMMMVIAEVIVLLMVVTIIPLIPVVFECCWRRG